MTGWIKLHRSFLESDLWGDLYTSRLFIFLLVKASHRDGVKINGIELKRGQYIRAYRKLTEDLSYKAGRGYKQVSLSTLKSSIDKLVKAERVNTEITDAGTLFTIVNYDEYQRLVGYSEPNPNTPIVNRKTINKPMPNEGQTINEQKQELKNLRIKEPKKYTSSEMNSAVAFYEEQGFGSPSPHIREKISEWIEKLSEELVILAMKFSIENSVLKWKYVEQILKSWSNQQFKTSDQVWTYEQKRKQIVGEKKLHLNRQELIPEWMESHKAQRLEEEESTIVDIEKSREKLMKKFELLKKKDRNRIKNN